MRNKIVLLFLAFAYSSMAFSEDVDPIGRDQYKTVIIRVRQLDKKNLQAVPSALALYFDDKSERLDTSLVNQGSDQVIQITVPKRNTGKFFLEYIAESKAGQHSPNGDHLMRHRILEGNVDSGVKEFEVRLKRIDVNHMLVTRPDGSTYWSKGKYTLIGHWPKLGGGSIEVFTGLGVDVPVGFRYSVQVSAQTEDGIDYYNADFDYTRL